MNNHHDNQSSKSAARLLALAAAFAVSFSASAETDISPKPAKPYPKASASLLLDIEDTAAGYIAVGERGHILSSTDANTWTQMPSPVNSMLTAVTFADELNGWAVGHDASIVHSNDGGKTWTLQHFEPSMGPLLNVYFDSAQHGFALGSFGVFLETKDGGKNWAPADAPTVTDAAVHLYSMIKLGSGRLLIVGEMGFIAVSDDGNSWTQLDSPYDGSFYSAAPYGDKGAVLVGMRGNVHYTADLDSNQWTKYETNSVLSLTSVIAIKPSNFLITTLNRGLLHVDLNGSIVDLPNGSETGKSFTGSFNDIVTVDGELLIASDEGVLRLNVPKVDI